MDSTLSEPLFQEGWTKITSVMQPSSETDLDIRIVPVSMRVVLYQAIILPHANGTRVVRHIEAIGPAHHLHPLSVPPQTEPKREIKVESNQSISKLIA